MLGLVVAMFQEGGMIRPVKVGAKGRMSAPAARPPGFRLGFLKPGVDGWLDGVTAEGDELLVFGWAFSRALPAAQIAVELRVGDRPLAVTVANDSRPDLTLHGMGDGHHGFVFRIPRSQLRAAAGGAMKVDLVIGRVDPRFLSGVGTLLSDDGGDMSRAILCIGQSHVAALRSAAKSRREADPDRPRTRVIHTIEPQYAPEVEGEGDQARFTAALEETIRDQVARHAPLVASASGGNVHNGFALIRHPRAYDFLLVGEDGPPLDPDAEPIPEAQIRGALEAALARDCLRLREIKRIAGDVIQLESPPPVADSGWIAAQADAYFNDRGLGEFGVASPTLRYKIWRLHSRIVAGYCAGIGMRFLPVPAETQDARGFLKPEYAGDATHGNEAYGEAVIRALEAL